MRSTMTRAETILWTRLRRRQLNGWHFRRQHPIGPYTADFACPARKLVVEVDGATHSTEAEQRHDRRRAIYLEEAGWTVMRFWNSDVYENEDGVVLMILNALPAPQG
jgi:very-short-patch-repair endonuclease